MVPVGPRASVRRCSAPWRPRGANELQALVEQIAVGVGQVLERRGLFERDIENAWLTASAEPGPLDDLIGHSITCRIAVGPRAGQKLFTLQAARDRQDGFPVPPGFADQARCAAYLNAGHPACRVGISRRFTVTIDSVMVNLAMSG